MSLPSAADAQWELKLFVKHLQNLILNLISQSDFSTSTRTKNTCTQAACAFMPWYIKRKRPRWQCCSWLTETGLFAGCLKDNWQLWSEKRAQQQIRAVWKAP